MITSMSVTTSSTLGLPGENQEAFPIYLINRRLANAEHDTDGISLQKHESQFFTGAPRAQGPGRDGKVSGCMSKSVIVYLIACNWCAHHH